MRINVFKSGGNSAEGGFVSNGLTLQGPLILSGPHTDHLHAVPKQYVDNATYNLDANNITSGVLAAARLPAFTGDATTILGTSNLILANTGVTPGSIIKPTVDAKGRVVSGGTITEADITAISFDKVTTGRPTTLNGYGITDGVPLSANISITGDFIQSSDPVTNNQIATKHYVDAAGGVAGGISVGDIIRKPYSTTPSGFLKCNGAEVDKTIYANLYSVIGDTFNNDLTIGSGRPWQQQYRFNDSQTADVLGWVSDTALPSVFSHTTVIATKNRVYALGGFLGSGSYSATVYTAPINEDGTLGAWVTGTSLPAGLIASSAIVTNNRVYLIGGATGTGTSISTVRTAVINSDGTLGTWTTGPSLPGNLAWTKSIITKNRVYTFGGWNGSVAISTIYTTTINSDGTLNSWSVHGTLPADLYVPYVAVIKDRVYIIGGLNGARLSSVYYAPIDNNGVIGTFTSGVFLPKGMSHGECFTTKNKIHISFGSEIWTSNINSDGSLGNWYKSASLPVDMGDTECVITSSKIYLISSTTLAGGYTNSVVSANFSGGLNDYSSYYSEDTTNYMMPGSGQPWKQQYQINTTQSADITGWNFYGTMPVDLSVTSAIVTKNRVYLCGGYGGSSVGAISTVYTAPINSDGTLGTWTTSGSLPGALNTSTAIVTKNRVYLCGGFNGTSALSIVYTAVINADGTLGAWSSATSLPAAVSGCVGILTRNRVYLMGGRNDTVYVSSVYTAPVNTDGTIGSWSIATSLPVGLYGSQAFVTKNRIYLCCGVTGSPGTYISTVYTAPINADGTLGTWSVWNYVPDALYASQVIVTSNRVYLLGGNNGVQDVLSVYSAVINSDGTISNWKLMSSLIGGVHWSQAIIVKNKVYLFGAWNSNLSSNQIFTATISSDIQDYSPYYDGSIQPISTVSAKFKLPDYTLLDKEFGEYVTSYIKY